MRKRIKYTSMMLLILVILAFMLTFQSVKVEAQCICSACSLICSNLNCFGKSAGDSWCRSSPNEDIKRECTQGSAGCVVSGLCGFCVFNCGIKDTDCGDATGDVDTGNRRWVSTGECTEKEQRNMQQLLGYCSSGDCRVMILGGYWEDTGANRCKSGTDCGTDVACVEDTCAVDKCSVVGTGRDYSCNDYGFPNCPCDYFTTGCEDYCDAGDYCSGDPGSCRSGRCGSTSCPDDYCPVPNVWRDYTTSSCNRYCDGSGNCAGCTCDYDETTCTALGCCDPTCSDSAGCGTFDDDSECPNNCVGDIRHYSRSCNSCVCGPGSTTDCSKETGCGDCGCAGTQKPNSCSCSGGSCVNSGCSVDPECVPCPGQTQSNCNSYPHCTWCTGDNSCKDNADWDCNPPACSGDDRCRNSCTWSDCGTDPCPSDSCNGVIFRDYPATCNQGCSGGSCDPCSCSSTNHDCSASGNWDGDAVACNCDCGGYDQIETGALCSDGLDNDCDGDPDGADSGCGVPCVPNGCNGNCPVGCDVSQDPDCGCQDGNGCCAPGCNNLNDNDCPSGMCSLTTSSVTPNCAGGSSTDCETGETIDIDSEFTGTCDIDANTYFRIKVRSLDGTCTVNLDKQNPSLGPGPTLDTVDLIAVVDGRVTFDRDIPDGCIDSPLAPVDDPESCFRHSTTWYIVCAWDQSFEPSGEEDVVRSYVEWDISSIPDASSVSNVDFIYHGEWGYGAARNIYIQRMDSRAVDHTLLSSLFNDMRTGPRYASHYPTTLPNTLVDLDNDARNDMNNALGTRDWFGIGLHLTNEGFGSAIVAEIKDEGDADANPKPTLRVEYYPPMIDDTWTISSIFGACGGKTVYAYEAELWDGQPGVGTLLSRITDSTPTDNSPVDGSFTFAAGCECSSGACCDGCNYRPSSYECRASTGVCDLSEYCTGSSSTCPSNSYRPPGFDCGDCRECDGSGSCNYLCSGAESSCECIGDACIDCSNYFGRACDYGTCNLDQRPSWTCPAGSCSYSCSYDAICTCDNDGVCDAGEDITTCPQDCCDNDCTAKTDSICHSECDPYCGIVDPQCSGDTINSCGDSSGDCFGCDYRTCNSQFGIACDYGTCSFNQRPSWTCVGTSCTYSCYDDPSCLYPCVLTSASITPNCGLLCEQGETISMSGDYTGDCSAVAFLQIDATGGGCDIQYTGGDMSGISSFVGGGGLNGGTFSATWTIPAIAFACSGKTVSATASALYDGSPSGGNQLSYTESVSGSFTFETLCDCSSGACCDGCNYRLDTFICQSQAQTQYICYWGTGCGDNVGVQYQDRNCSGSSASCDGALGSWYTVPPNVQDDCTGSEKCAAGDSTCNYDYCGCVAYCDDGICDPACGEDENNCVVDCGDDLTVETRIDVLDIPVTGVTIDLDGDVKTTDGSGLTTYRITSGLHDITSEDPVGTRPFSHFWDHDANADCNENDPFDTSDNPYSFNMNMCDRTITAWYKVFTKIENSTGNLNSIDYNGYTISGYLLREDDNALHYGVNVNLEYYDGSWNPIIITTASTVDGYFAEPWLSTPEATTIRATFVPSDWFYVASSGQKDIEYFDYVGASQVNFSGKLEYKDNTPVEFAKITVTITYQQKEYIGKSASDINGDFFIKVDIPSYLIGADYWVNFYVRNDIEAVYECWYDHITEQCTPQ